MVKIAVLKETAAGETRVAASPETVKKYIGLGAEVAVEAGAGLSASVSDADYAATTEVGAVIAPPTFVQASAQFDPDYPLRPTIGAQWFGSGKNPSSLTKTDSSGTGGGGNGGVLHAER